MQNYAAEFVGTALLLLLGGGVCANVSLTQTKGHGAGWIVIAMGWGMAVFVAVLCTMDISGAHINPAVTFGLALGDRFAWSDVPGYVGAQIAGGVAGGLTVWLFYRPHFAATDDPDTKLGVFCTGPQFRQLGHSFFCEAVATFALVFPVFCIAGGKTTIDGREVPVGLGSLGALPVALVVVAIGLCLGGTTGYAINPARDLGPRIAHAIAPIPGKRDADWGYAWVPIAGPLAGGALAAALAAAML